MTRNVLDKQLDDRSKKIEEEKNDDIRYAQYIRKSLETMNDLEAQRKKKEQEERMNYKKVLEKQIEDNNKKRMYRNIMSEYEKKINNEDLEAYKQWDVHIHSKVIGTKDIAHVNSNPGREISNPKLKDSEILRKYKSTAVSSRNYGGYITETNSNKDSPRLYELARQNMEDPRIKYMRNDTYNKAYGYRNQSYDNRVSDTNNRSFEVSSYRIFNKDQINPLTAAGKSQIGDPITIDLPHKKLISNRLTNSNNQKGSEVEIAAGGTVKRYGNYNIITGSNPL